MYTASTAWTTSSSPHAGQNMWVSPAKVLIWMALAGVAGVVHAARIRNNEREDGAEPGAREERQHRREHRRRGSVSSVTAPHGLSSVYNVNSSVWTTTTAVAPFDAKGVVDSANLGEALPTEPSLQGLVPGSIPGHRNPGDVQVGCNELRSKRYITDGFCTSVRPITEVVCTGHCLPVRNLPWYAQFIKVWAKTKILEYRCVDDKVRRKRVKLHCENGVSRSYKIKVVKSCKCKRYRRSQNESQSRFSNRGHHPRRKLEDYSEESDDEVLTNGSQT